jgi:hypothetical protein
MQEQETNFFNFQDFISKAMYIQILRVDDTMDDDEEDDILEKVLDRLYHSSNGEADIEAILEHDIIYWVYVVLDEQEYYKVTKAKISPENHKKSDFFWDLFSEGDQIMYLYEVQKVKIPRQRKSIEALELDLKEAEETQNYELAAKIKKQIDNKRKPKKAVAKTAKKVNKKK